MWPPPFVAEPLISQGPTQNEFGPQTTLRSRDLGTCQAVFFESINTTTTNFVVLRKESSSSSSEDLRCKILRLGRNFCSRRTQAAVRVEIFRTGKDKKKGENMSDMMGSRHLAKMPSKQGSLGRQCSEMGRIRDKKAKNFILGRMRTAFNKYSSLLLTSALGIDLVVTRMGYPYIAQFISGMLVIFYLINFISLRRAVCSFWSAVVDIFFREISVGGLQKLEPLEDGRAVIFACAPHVNQFIDPLLVMKVVAEATGRHVSFMTAEKSFERNVVGAIMRAVKAIPVVRPDDLERKGAGFITCSGTHVQGYAGTSFSRDFVMGALLVVKTKEGKKTAKVVKVLDDANMELAEPGLKGKAAAPTTSDMINFDRVLSPGSALVLLVVFSAPLLVYIPPLFPTWLRPISYLTAVFAASAVTNLIYKLTRDGLSGQELFGGIMTEYSFNEGAAPKEVQVAPEGSDHGTSYDIAEKVEYSLQPFVDQTEMWENVTTSLLGGGTIGIFPEGGTHDGTTLLPLKWGISVMLLGAMARRETMKKPIKISVVPVGLNYFAPHKFRSTVSIDFGDPIEVHNDLAMQWKNGTKEEKAAANAAVMELLMAGVNSCTLQATDFTTLEIFRTIRRLYAPSGMRLTVADNVALTAGFANGFHKVKDAPRVQDIMQRCHKYNTMLSTYRVDDRNVQRLAGNSFSARDRVRLVRVTVLKLLHLALFGAILVPWMLCAAPVSLFLSCASDHKAKEVKKMSVKGTWKLLLAPFALILLHVSCSSAIFFSFGEIAALVWVFFGAMYAILTFEDGVKAIKSLNALVMLGWQGDIGKRLFDTREGLKKDIRMLKNKNDSAEWLGELAPQIMNRLSASQSFLEEDVDESSFEKLESDEAPKEDHRFG